MKLGLVWAVAASAIGSGFQHGYNTGVVNSPQKVMVEWTKSVLKNPSDQNVELYWSVIVSIFCIGGMLGGALTSVMSNRFGRKGALLLNNILVFIAAGLMFTSKYLSNVYMLIGGRFVIGVNAGLNAGLAPTYLNEISPVNKRGAIGSVYQLVITITILIAQILGISECLGTETLWPYLIGLVIVIPAIYQTSTLYHFKVESPRYLLHYKQDYEGAKQALEHLYKNDEALIEQVMRETEEDVESDENAPYFKKAKDLIYFEKLRTPLLIVCIVMIAQQVSGYNSLVYHSTTLFNMGYINLHHAHYMTTGMLVLNVLCSLASLLLIEVWGRKPLLLISFAGMSATTIAQFGGIYFTTKHHLPSYPAVIVSYAYIVFYAFGAGSIPWIITQELFTTTYRTTAVSISITLHWLLDFSTTAFFFPVIKQLESALFLLYLICQVISFVVVWIFVPETKNKSVREISRLF